MLVMSTMRNTQAGVTGGILFSVFPLIGKDDIIRTLLLAAIGAVASFTVSYLLQWVFPRRRDKD